MKLKTTGLLTLVSVLGFTANANAGAVMDVYAGATAGSGGITLFSGDDKASDSAFTYGAVFGIDIPVLRAEVEYNHLSNSDIKMDLAMLNAYLKMPSTVIKPYMGIGIGTAFNGTYADTTDISSTAAYQGMLGITFDMPVMPFKIDLEARALYVPNFVEFYTLKPDLFGYDFRIKLRYVF
ncbi:MAG: outer membrane beta-barrel protein [Alphaproteobacteria bacterium]|nr:outer membrane beta-barrel protein [Alphaproteobacteria bacterium]MBN2675055.1 outer membrane beta-barrel protein [Alphaproteobacteria bacterium]